MKISRLLPLVAFTAMGLTSMGQSAKIDNGLNMANLDTSTKPGTDFYQFATGGWQKLNPLPDAFSRFGTFDQLGENNKKQIKELILDLGKEKQAQGTLGQKIGDLYAMGMDSIMLNKEGATPVLPQLKAVDNAKTLDEVIQQIAKVREYASSPFFAMYVGADDKNSSRNILQISQDGLGMGDRDYYLQNDTTMQKLRKGYVELIVKQFENLGYKAPAAKEIAASVMTIETALAKAHFPKEKTRVPELNYHLLQSATLNDSIAEFPWEMFFQAAGIKEPKDLNVAQIEPLKGAIKIIETTPLGEVKDYLKWTILNSAAGYLSDTFVNTNFDFYGKQLAGSKVLRPRWNRTVSTVNSTLGEAVGQMYVAKYFPQEAKDRMMKLVKNLQVSLSERIDAQTWMSPETKAKAQDKLSHFIVKIGYPDKWRDYSKLEIKDDSYWANIVRSSKFESDYMIAKLDKPVDKSEWLMSPQTVNAYYNPTTNEICFPAGILQPPFFYQKADDAVNYGAIGVVIGHEMTHGFDDQGRKYDKEGNMTDWWTPEDAKKFEARTQVMVDFFNNIVVADTIHANGKFTLGENLADHGGLQVAYNAFQKTAESKEKILIDGYTPAQRFFLSYANVWAGNIRKAEILRRTKIDPHALGKWRVDGALPQIQAWYDAFRITPKDPMYVPAEKRVTIW